MIDNLPAIIELPNGLGWLYWQTRSLHVLHHPIGAVLGKLASAGLEHDDRVTGSFHP